MKSKITQSMKSQKYKKYTSMKRKSNKTGPEKK